MALRVELVARAGLGWEEAGRMTFAEAAAVLGRVDELERARAG